MAHIIMDVPKHEVYVAGKPKHLANKEFLILKALIEAQGNVLSRKQLMEVIWPGARDIDSRVIDQHIARARMKFGSFRECIESVPGYGYKVHDAEFAGGPVDMPVRTAKKLLREVADNLKRGQVLTLSVS